MRIKPSPQGERLRAAMRDVGGRRMAEASGPDINGRVEVWIVPRTGGTVILHEYGEPYGCEFYRPAGDTMADAEAFIRTGEPSGAGVASEDNAARIEWDAAKPVKS
jgi:hypothetical protein